MTANDDDAPEQATDQATEQTAAPATENGAANGASNGLADDESRRRAVRLTTVFGGRVCQYGKAYPCVISDVSEGGAKVRLKHAPDYNNIKQSGEIQLVFERLSDYKALNTVVAWKKPAEHILGLRFVDPELRRRVVMRRLMPNRWKLATEHNRALDAADQAALNGDVGDDAPSGEGS